MGGTETIVRVTSKGQATIPAELRARYGIKAPGAVRIVDEEGRLVIEPVPSVEEMFGSMADLAGGGTGSRALVEERRRDKRRENRRART